jgi:phosphate transport system protein
MTVERSIDAQLDELKKLILIMGGHVERALQEVTTAILNKDHSRFKNVFDLEDKINEAHVQVDNFCVQLLAKQSPVAKDLRFILSIVKINTDLERMGDQTKNIAYTGQEYLVRPALAQIEWISKMSESVRKMVHGSLDAFVRSDIELAQKILLMDDEVDEFKNKVIADLSEHMKKHPSDIDASLDLIVMARNFERLGDHATNVAEDVIFACTGKDVRHGGIYG